MKKKPPVIRFPKARFQNSSHCSEKPSSVENMSYVLVIPIYNLWTFCGYPEPQESHWMREANRTELTGTIIAAELKLTSANEEAASQPILQTEGSSPK